MRHAVSRLIVGIAAAIMLVSAGTAQTAHPELNADKSGVLLKGYDPVAYFRGGAPAKGSAQFSASHNGATFHFASAANRDEFQKQPDKYVPAYGGFCAFGVASGYKVDADPTVWKIVDGRLYVNYNRSVGHKFSADTATYIKQAEDKWPALKDKPASK